MAAVAVIAGGCQISEEPEGPKGGTLRVYATEMASLVPGEAGDSASIQVIRQLYAGLTAPGDDGSPQNHVAESITSQDNLTWTVKLKKGLKFHNGEPVIADSFIDAWNYTAYGPTSAANSRFMERIEGYADLQSGRDPDGTGPEKAPAPKARQLSGLKKVDDHTFTVKLDKPFAGFPAMVGYSGFFPQPKACFAAEAMKEGRQVRCKDEPIGNGRYKISGRWEHNSKVILVRNEGYAGDDKGKVAELVYKIYDRDTTGYAAFEAGELDIMHTVPAAKIQEIKQKYAQQLLEKPNNQLQVLGFPLYQAQFQNPKIREAFSYAIDRQKIIDSVFLGNRFAAQSFVSPLLKGYRAGVCAACAYDPAKAKQLLEEAGGWTGGKLVISANAGASHELWLAPLAEMLKANLGIDYELKADQAFTPYLEALTGRKMPGPYRLAWAPEYATFDTYLAPLYVTNAPSNYSGYGSKEFDDLVAKGNAAKTEDEAIKFYQQAEDILVRDLPVLPLWFGKHQVLYARNVKGVSVNPISDVEYHKIELK